MDIKNIASRSLEDILKGVVKYASEGYQIVDGSGQHYFNGLFSVDMFIEKVKDNKNVMAYDTKKKGKPA